jgi:hypothetical protein
VLAPPAIGMYRFFTRRASLIYCDRLFSQYKASDLSEASCLIGPNELDTAKMTVIGMKLLIALGHRIISVHVLPKKPPMEFVSLSLSLICKQRRLTFINYIVLNDTLFMNDTFFI